MHHTIMSALSKTQIRLRCVVGQCSYLGYPGECFYTLAHNHMRWCQCTGCIPQVSASQNESDCTREPGISQTSPSCHSKARERGSHTSRVILGSQNIQFMAFQKAEAIVQLTLEFRRLGRQRRWTQERKSSSCLVTEMTPSSVDS